MMAVVIGVGVVVWCGDDVVCWGGGGVVMLWCGGGGCVTGVVVVVWCCGVVVVAVMVVVVPLQPQRLHVASHVEPGPLHPQPQPGSVL